MRLFVCDMSALKAIRQLRSARRNLAAFSRVGLGLCEHDGNRWSMRPVREALGRAVGNPEPFSKGTVSLMVTTPKARVLMRHVHSRCCTVDLPRDAFIRLNREVAISSPELLFIEMGREMHPIVHLLLGMELCGGFSRDAGNPRTGDATYSLPPATSVEKLRDFMGRVEGMHGLGQARETLDLLLDDAWSPMEALVAALALLPLEDLGFGLAPIVLNRREEAAGRGAPSEKGSRVPDIMFAGTNVGLNYDGSGHMGLDEIAQSAIDLGSSPGDGRAASRLDQALAKARALIVDDKRRDRDLVAMGLDVLAVTYEDLARKGGFDLVMRQVIAAIERGSGRNLSVQKRALESDLLRKLRQDFIWSLLPGATPPAREAPYAKLERLGREDIVIKDLDVESLVFGVA